jgi:hypothetical protein
MKLNSLITSWHDWAVIFSTILMMMALAGSALAGPCAKVQIDTKSAPASKDKCGYPEIGCPTPNPAHFYLNQTIAGTGNYFYYSYESTSGSTFQTGFFTETQIGIYDPANNCTNTTTWFGVAQAHILKKTYLGVISDQEDYSGSVNGSGMWIESDGGDAVSLVGSWINLPLPDGSQTTTYSPCAPTSAATHQSGSYTSSGSVGLDFIFEHITLDGKQTTNISKLYTDEMLREYLIKAIPAYPSDWATNINSSAYYHLNSLHSHADGARMKYRFHVTDCVPSSNVSYLVEWDEVTTYDDSTVPASIVHMKERIPGSADPVNGVYGSEHEADVPLQPCNITENVLNPPTIIPTGPPGE